MITEFYGEYSAFVNAVLLGVLFGIIYDIFRILRIARVPYLIPSGKFYELIKIPERKNKKQKNILKKFTEVSDAALTFAEDIAFWIIATIGKVLFIYHVNGGVVRIYFIFCTFIGAALYFFTAGKITSYFSIRIIFLLRCLFYWSFYIIIYPVRLVWLSLVNIISFLINITLVPLVNSLEKRKLRSYSKKRIVRILMKSRKGFFTYD